MNNHDQPRNAAAGCFETGQLTGLRVLVTGGAVRVGREFCRALKSMRWSTMLPAIKSNRCWMNQRLKCAGNWKSI